MHALTWLAIFCSLRLEQLFNMHTPSSQSGKLLLIGYRGTGKTVVAEQLAERLGEKHIDTDRDIETVAGRTIARIFSESGEEEFRSLETEALCAALKRDGRILALGGGVVLREENRSMLKNAGTTVLLQAAPETIFARLAGDPTTEEHRPNLTGGGLEEIVEVLEIRRELYRQCADLIVDTEDKTPAQVADEILAKCRLKTQDEE